MMSPRKFGKLLFMMAVVLWAIGSETGLAVWAPEPESGGQFFRSKGTMSSRDYYYLGRTGTRDSDDYYYGQGLRAGDVILQPRVSYTGEYDNNIFLAPSKKKDDYVNRIDWGLEAFAPIDSGKYLLYSGVQSQSEIFSRHDKADHTDWFYQGGGRANFNRFSFSVYEDWRKTSERSGTELTRFLSRNENYLMGLLEIPMSEVFFENEISHYYLKFRTDGEKLNNRWEIREIPRFGMNIGDRTQALVEYAITPIRYFSQTDRNGLSQEWALGLRGLLGKGDLVSYQAWAGWENRNYNSGDRKDFRNAVCRGDIRYRPSDLTEFVAEIVRNPEESVTETNSYVVRNDLTARYRRRVVDHGVINLGGTTGLFDYSSKRTDFYWSVFTKIEVLLPGKFSSIFGEYSFQQRHSNQSANDYADNRVNFGVKLEV